MTGWEVRFARPEDFPSLMRLQDRPMPGPIRLAMSREPGPSDRIVVAVERDRLMGMGIRSRAIHRWSGQSRTMGVLSGVRSDCAVLPRRIAAEMFRQLRASRAVDEPEWDLTAILESNRNARRLFEAGLPGLPRYSPVARLVTFTFAAARSASAPAVPGTAASVPVFQVDERGNRCRVATIPGRRTWVSGYSRSLSLARPLLNPCLRLAGFPRLPDPGKPVPEAFVNEAEISRPDAGSVAAFLAGIRARAGSLGADWVHWGMTVEKAKDLGLMARARAWRTFSIAYAVHDAGSPAPSLPDFDPEIARL